MATAVARGKGIKIAPRKVRLVADMIRGKTVAEARDILHFTVKAAAPVLGKLLESAAANAQTAAAEERERIDPDEMVVNRILVDGGPTTMRWSPQPRGRATRLRKRTSHVKLSISNE